MDPVPRALNLSVETTSIKQKCVDADRITNLPPELIGIILSLLPLKEAVSTSVLSTKWKWYWTFITRLRLCDNVLGSYQPSFLCFMDRFLHRKTTALDHFSVICYYKSNIPRLREWVSAALLLDVKEIAFTWGATRVTHVLPFDLFSQKKLLKLILGGDCKIDVPDTVCLQSLKCLQLSGVSFHDDDSIKRLLSGCPALEEVIVSNIYSETPPVLPQELFSCRKLTKLELYGHMILDVRTVVSLPNLRVLHLNNVLFSNNDSAKRLLCGCPSLQQLNIIIEQSLVLHVDAPILSDLTIFFFGANNVCRKVVLETPSLRYLKLEGFSADSYELIGSNQLQDADLWGIYFGTQYEAVTNLIKGTSDAKSLRLSCSVMKAIVKSGCELPKFHKLTTLRLGLSSDAGWPLLPDLLEKSPFLEKLVFVHGLYRLKELGSLANATWRPPQKVPYCLLHHLKFIQINCFLGDIQGDEIIRYFIENRGALNDLTTKYPGGSVKFNGTQLTDD